eukprot:3000317-Amphidinium_carterae.1
MDPCAGSFGRQKRHLCVVSFAVSKVLLKHGHVLNLAWSCTAQALLISSRSAREPTSGSG